jgi:hypothetical protein
MNNVLLYLFSLNPREPEPNFIFRLQLPPKVSAPCGTAAGSATLLKGVWVFSLYWLSASLVAAGKLILPQGQGDQIKRCVRLDPARESYCVLFHIFPWKNILQGFNLYFGLETYVQNFGIKTRTPPSPLFQNFFFRPAISQYLPRTDVLIRLNF